ncbi:transcriptional coactivator p15/PC4 family protein [Bradyrhizobium sp. dw_78]|uniref:transcriptional coactivator p15/PC4 family protein n=1 Tax=Bradyrhizobium sp. dw_78 TaxID=2719793 RepID=UPI001BD29253|nr:transcriptional coactivator p15/PC4 family protein [Bradyrhizobium sp. dw_78]
MKNPAVRGRGRKADRCGRWSQPLDICSDPEFATSPADDPLAEDIKVADVWKGRRRVNHVRVTLKRYKGRPILDIRQFFVGSDGCSRPTTRGVAIGIDRLPEIRKALEKAEVLAIELGLLEAVQ